MEWVETTGRSVEDAKDAALDRLGVDESEAEFEILEEGKAGLFGRVRREARVRARIKPTRPRAKQDRRDRRRKSRSRGNGRGGGRSDSRGASARDGDGQTADAPAGGAEPKATTTKPRRRGGRGRSGAAAAERSGPRQGQPAAEAQPGEQAMAEVSLQEQGEMVQDFLDGLVDAFDLDGELQTKEIDEAMLEVQIIGEDLGLLIGPKGQTLLAIQELARTVVQRRADGHPQGRFRIDVGGYRERRREALARFAVSVADEVRSTGVQKALEPMNAADRKVVHDTINELDGVATTSEGEEPHRRVVILPAT